MLRRMSGPKSEGGRTIGAVQVLDRNIEALIAHRRQMDSAKSRQDRVTDAITAFTGTMRFVYIQLAGVAAWMLWNSGWLGLPAFDPTFVLLATLASVEAIFLSTFVLISQNHMSVMADRRADLDLQISLLTEHELTRLLQLVTEIGKRLEVEASHDPDLEEFGQQIAPTTVLDKLEQVEEEVERKVKTGSS